MYCENWVRRHEITGMDITVRNAADTRQGPPQDAADAEEGTGLARMLDEASTEDERLLIALIDGLADDRRMYGAGKAPKTLLRARWREAGGPMSRYYKAFRALSERWGRVVWQRA